MASFNFSKPVMVPLVLFFFLLAPSIAIAGRTLPLSGKCIRHHASLTAACERYLHNKVPEEQQLTHPTQECCSTYNEIIRSGTPACFCRYLQRKRLKNLINVTKLMSLHDLCPSSNPVPLSDLCVALDNPDRKFNAIREFLATVCDSGTCKFKSINKFGGLY